MLVNKHWNKGANKGNKKREIIIIAFISKPKAKPFWAQKA
jgi:hypothetical protein